MQTLDYQSRPLARRFAENYQQLRNLALSFILLQIMLLLMQVHSSVWLHHASAQANERHLITFATGAEALLRSDALTLVSVVTCVILIALIVTDIRLLAHVVRDRSNPMIAWPDSYWRWRSSLAISYMLTLLLRSAACGYVFQEYHVIDRTRAAELFSFGLVELVVGTVVTAAIIFDGRRATPKRWLDVLDAQRSQSRS